MVIFVTERVVLLGYALMQSVMPSVPEDVTDQVARCVCVKKKEGRREKWSKNKK